MLLVFWFSRILVDINDTIKGFKGLCNGDYVTYLTAFYMVGTIEDAIKGEELAKKNNYVLKTKFRFCFTNVINFFRGSG